MGALKMCSARKTVEGKVFACSVVEEHSTDGSATPHYWRIELHLRAALRICAAYEIYGTADPGYIADVIRAELEAR